MGQTQILIRVRYPPIYWIFFLLLEYSSFNIMNIHFVFLNGGSSGYIDHEQREWFRNDIKQNTDRDTILVIVCHQPSLGSVTSERGIPETMRDVLSDYEGEVWMVAGHAHHNSDQCFRLPKSIITQATITSGNPTGWGTENPGYWIYGFSKGKLTTRIFRKLGEGYAIASPPNLENEPRKYFVSPDAENWDEVTTVHREGSYTSFPIPQKCLDSGTIAVRIEQCVVSGFALTE